jgi:hypothetical protein
MLLVIDRPSRENHSVCVAMAIVLPARRTEGIRIIIIICHLPIFMSDSFGIINQ